MRAGAGVCLSEEIDARSYRPSLGEEGLYCNACGDPKAKAHSHTRRCRELGAHERRLEGSIQCSDSLNTS